MPALLQLLVLAVALLSVAEATSFVHPGVFVDAKRLSFIKAQVGDEREARDLFGADRYAERPPGRSPGRAVLHSVPEGRELLTRQQELQAAR
jgi:hypothetical protein